MATQTILKRQANFLLSEGTLELLKKYVPSKKQSEFVEEMVVRELKKRAFLKVLKKTTGGWKNHKEDTHAFIRSLRYSKRI